MKRVSVLVLGFLFFFNGYAQKSQPFETYLNAVSQYEKGSYASALNLFTEAEEGGIHTSTIYNYVGNCHFEMAKYEEALKAYNKALEINPTDYTAKSNLCNTYYRLKMYKETSALAESLIKSGVYLANGYNSLGNVSFSNKNYLEAIGYYRKALTEEPGLSYGPYNIGNSYFQMHNYDSALYYHLKGRERAPDDLKNLNNLAMCYSNLHQYDKSIAVSREIIERNPNYYKAYAEIGYAMMEASNYNPDEVIYYLQKAIDIAPNEGYATYTNLGNAYFKKGLYGKALESYNKSLSINPHNAIAYSGRSLIYRDSMLYELSIADIMMATRLDSSFAYPFLSLGAIMMRLDDTAAAALNFNKYIRISGYKPEAYSGMYNTRGYNLALKGDYSGCIKDMQRAIDIDPKYAYAWNNMGFSYAKLGKSDSAFICLNKSEQLDPYNSYVYHNRAFAWLVSGNESKACEDLKKAKAMHFPVQVDPLLAELNKRNCKLEFSSKSDTFKVDLKMVARHIDSTEKVLKKVEKPDMSNAAAVIKEDEKLDLVQSVYPNPASTEFALTLKAKNDKPIEIMVLTSNGVNNKSIVLSETGRAAFTINCSDWVPGNYVLVLQMDKRQVGIVRVSVQH